MYILGDIGNSDTKIFLVNKKDRILKRTSLISKNINNKNLDKKIRFLIKDIKKVEKILFCSVVPKSKIIKLSLPFCRLIALAKRSEPACL